MAEAFLSENLPENMFGAPKAGPGMWASCIRVLDPSEGNTLQQINLEQNEAAVRFESNFLILIVLWLRSRIKPIAFLLKINCKVLLFFI